MEVILNKSLSSAVSFVKSHLYVDDIQKNNNNEVYYGDKKILDHGKSCIKPPDSKDQHDYIQYIQYIFIDIKQL